MKDTRYAWRLVALMLLLAAAAAGPVACDDGSSSDSDTDTDTDSDSDSDTDTDSDTDLADCSACTAEICYNRIQGKVVTEGEAELGVQICAPSCMPAAVEEDGTYYINFTSSCMEFPLTTGEEIHVTISENAMDNNLDTHTRYTFGFHPGEDDFVEDQTLEVRDLPRLEIPSTGADYTAASGATVDDLNGVSIDIAAGQLGDEDAQVRVFEHPMGDDTPPFVPEGMELDALFFLAPYFYGETPFTVEIDATIPGWDDGETGAVYQLGDYTHSHFLDCPGSDEHVELGKFVECGTATTAGGIVTIENVPLLGWIGLGPAVE